MNMMKLRLKLGDKFDVNYRESEILEEKKRTLAAKHLLMYFTLEADNRVELVCVLSRNRFERVYRRLDLLHRVTHKGL